MSVIALQVFVSLMLVASALVLFVWTMRQRTIDHADRLSLAPLEEDEPSPRRVPSRCVSSADDVASPKPGATP